MKRRLEGGERERERERAKERERGTGSAPPGITRRIDAMRARAHRPSR